MQHIAGCSVTDGCFRLSRYVISAIILLLSAGVLTASVAHTDAPLGPPHQVRTTNPKVGVHTRLTDEVEAAKIRRTLEMVREMGARWIVEYFPWAYIEPLPGLYDWKHADLVIDHAIHQGLTVIARLGMVPQWARPPDSAPSFLDEERYPDFARFVGDFASRYDGRVHYIVIWNEPNLSLEWGFRPVSPDAYTRLLKMAYQAAKASSLQVNVLAGAFAPTLAPAGDEWAMNDLDYLRAMLDAGAAEYFDALAVHAYGWTDPADAPPDAQVVNFRRVELLRRILVEYGAGDKPIMITEGGWNDHPRWTRAVKPAQRIQYTLRAYQLAAEWDWCVAVVLWAFRYPWPAGSYLDYYTFVTPSFDPKPIYLEVQRYATP